MSTGGYRGGVWVDHQFKGMDAISLEGNCKRHQVIGEDEAIYPLQKRSMDCKKEKEKKGWREDIIPCESNADPW